MASSSSVEGCAPGYFWSTELGGCVAENICGNLVKESGEECDGGPLCLSNCTIDGVEESEPNDAGSYSGGYPPFSEYFSDGPFTADRYYYGSRSSEDVDWIEIIGDGSEVCVTLTVPEWAEAGTSCNYRQKWLWRSDNHALGISYNPACSSPWCETLDIGETKHLCFGVFADDLSNYGDAGMNDYLLEIDYQQ